MCMPIMQADGALLVTDLGMPRIDARRERVVAAKPALKIYQKYLAVVVDRGGRASPEIGSVVAEGGRESRSLERLPPVADVGGTSAVQPGRG